MIRTGSNIADLGVTAMSNLPRSLGDELDRMNAVLSSGPAELREREELHEQHVTDFVSLLRTPVRDALREEALSLTVSELTADAAPLVGQPFGPSVPTEGADGAHVAHDDLVQQLRKAVQSVSDHEVEGHATRLAQLLLSNWFGLLEHAMQDNKTDLLELDVDALPKTANIDAVLRGVAAYVLPPLAAATELRRYQRRLAVGSSTALSPTLHLFRDRRGWQVARTPDAARRAVLPDGESAPGIQTDLT